MPISNRGKYSQESNGKLSDLLTLGKWKQGIVNRIDEYQLPTDALVDALNVDIRQDGSVKSRDGYVKLIEGKCHSVFSFKNKLYYVKDTNFVRVGEDLIEEVLINNYTNSQVYYVEVAGELYFATENYTHKINKFGNLESWGIKSPTDQCEVVVGEEGSGLMKKGRYLVNYSYLYGNYETAIHPLSVVIDVAYDNFNITANCIPSSQSTSANFYISSLNGEELYFAKSGYEVEIDAYDKVSKSPKEISDAIPALENLCFANGRIWGTKGNYLYFSNDRDYRQCNPTLYMGIDGSEIVLMKAVDNGVYVVTKTATYFLQTRNPEDTQNMQLVKIFEHSAIKGTLFEDDKTVGWLSSEGYIIGDNQGGLKNMSEDKIDFSKNYTEGSSVKIKKNGIDKVIFSLKENGEKSSFQTFDKNNEDNLI